jgi:hypothetical protein
VDLMAGKVKKREKKRGIKALNIFKKTNTTEK